MLPLLYLHGLSSSDFAPAPEQFLGSAAGHSPAAIPRMTSQWQDEAAPFNTRSLAGTDDVWVDGIHLKFCLNQDKICLLLVMIGVRADGRKELSALDDGHRESAESWADLLRDFKRRGMAASVLAIGDGALGFWSAVRDVFSTTRKQRCWFHKIANVLNALPKSAQPSAEKALSEIWQAEDRTHAEAAAKVFADPYGAKWLKAVAKVTDDQHQGLPQERHSRNVLSLVGFNLAVLGHVVGRILVFGFVCAAAGGVLPSVALARYEIKDLSIAGICVGEGWCATRTLWVSRPDHWLRHHLRLIRPSP